MRSTHLKLLVILPLLGLGACVAMENKQGHIIRKDAVDKFAVGQTTKDEVLSALGTPSTVSDFGPERWYYLSKTTETRAILNPEISDAKALEIEFDETGKIKTLNQYGKNDLKQLEYTEDKTPTEGQKYSIVKQLLGNIGRFNKEPVD